MVEPLIKSGAHSASLRFSDLLLAAVFLAAVSWGICELFVPRGRGSGSDKPSLRPARITPDIAKLRQRLKQAIAIKPRAEWRPRHLSNQWQWIVIHHSATFSGNAAAFDRYHSQTMHMKNGLAYHFVIGNGNGSKDGRVEVGGRWRRQLPGGHVRGDELNRIAIGICLVGDFNEQLPTQKQLNSLKGLLVYLLRITSVKKDHVVGHRDMPGQATVCPGVLTGYGALIQ